eukprot:5278899-Prymnesium_polylepis.1
MSASSVCCSSSTSSDAGPAGGAEGSAGSASWPLIEARSPPRGRGNLTGVPCALQIGACGLIGMAASSAVATHCAESLRTRPMERRRAGEKASARSGSSVSEPGSQSTSDGRKASELSSRVESFCLASASPVIGLSDLVEERGTSPSHSVVAGRASEAAPLMRLSAWPQLACRGAAWRPPTPLSRSIVHAPSGSYDASGTEVPPEVPHPTRSASAPSPSSDLRERRLPRSPPPPPDAASVASYSAVAAALAERSRPASRGGATGAG